MALLFFLVKITYPIIEETINNLIINYGGKNYEEN